MNGAMKKGYVLARVHVTNPETYQGYRARVLPTIEAFGGRFLVRGGAVDVKEGAWRDPRLVVLEFPTVEAARAWYASPAYQAILPLRQNNSTADVVIVEGV
jgi:uncharacterized protein (DUF1330 family)